MQKALPCNQELIRSSCAGVLRNDHERAREGHIWGTRVPIPLGNARGHGPRRQVTTSARPSHQFELRGLLHGQIGGLGPLWILSMYLAARRNKPG